MEYLHQDLTKEIINAFYSVYNTHGYGFLEKVYENALMKELKSRGLSCEQQLPIKVFYKESKVGEYYVDIVVEKTIILELKAAEQFCQEHECQLFNYLKATDMEIGLLLNFGRNPDIKKKYSARKNDWEFFNK